MLLPRVAGSARRRRFLLRELESAPLPRHRTFTPNLLRMMQPSRQLETERPMRFRFPEDEPRQQPDTHQHTANSRYKHQRVRRPHASRTACRTQMRGKPVEQSGTPVLCRKTVQTQGSDSALHQHQLQKRKSEMVAEGVRRATEKGFQNDARMP